MRPQLVGGSKVNSVAVTTSLGLVSWGGGYRVGLLGGAVCGGSYQSLSKLPWLTALRLLRFPSQHCGPNLSKDKEENSGIWSFDSLAPLIDYLADASTQ